MEIASIGYSQHACMTAQLPLADCAACGMLTCAVHHMELSNNVEAGREHRHNTL